MSIPNDSTYFVLYLSAEGDSVRIDQAPNQDHCCRQSKFSEEATSCKTHKQVLEFLEKIASPASGNPSLQFYHANNTAYDKHSGAWSKIEAHEYSLDTQISFVKYKILEQEHGVRHYSQNSWCILQ